MLDNKLFLNAIEQLHKERSIPMDTLKEAIQEAFVKTYHKEFDPEADLRVDVDIKKGEIKLFHIKKVVDKIEDELTEILVKDAQKINSDLKTGDSLENEVEFSKDFSTLAALQVKQIIRQKIREKEKELVLTEFNDRIGDIIEGNIEKEKDNFYIVAFEKTFGFLNKSQVPKSLSFGPGDKVRAVVERVDPNSKGVPIILSMNSVELVKRILEEEIPEIQNGTIIIDKIARYGGVRTKMIVKSTTPGLEAVGTIVGPKGERIQRVIAKVGREFIDIIPQLEELDKQIARAFVPAKPLFVKIEDNKATVVVKEEEFSSAIGRGGSNAKVVSRLLDTEIDVVKEADVDFEIPSDFDYSDNRKANNKWNEVDASQYMIDEDEMIEDTIFQEEKIEQPQEENLDYESFPELDDYDGFAEDPNEMDFDDLEESVNESNNKDDDDFDKYYE